MLSVTFIVGDAIRTQFQTENRQAIMKLLSDTQRFPRHRFHMFRTPSELLLESPEAFDYDDWCVFTALLRICRSVLASRPASQTLLYVVSVLAVWAFFLPLGDWVAEQLERAQKTPAQVGETGYGWYYWDDSGMGGDPMSIGHILRSAILIPVLPILWLTFCYIVLRLRTFSRPNPS